MTGLFLALSAAAQAAPPPPLFVGLIFADAESEYAVFVRDDEIDVFREDNPSANQLGSAWKTAPGEGKINLDPRDFDIDTLIFASGLWISEPLTESEGGEGIKIYTGDAVPLGLVRQRMETGDLLLSEDIGVEYFVDDDSGEGSYVVYSPVADEVIGVIVEELNGERQIWADATPAQSMMMMDMARGLGGPPEEDAP